MIDTSITTEAPRDVVLETLTSAAEKVRHGWVKGHWSLDGSYCTIGAIEQALSESSTLRRGDDYYRVRRTCAQLLGFSDAGEIPAWNDAPWRTKGSVLRRFKRAIKKRRRCAELGEKTDG